MSAKELGLSNSNYLTYMYQVKQSEVVCLAEVPSVCPALQKLLEQLQRVEAFYDSIGGLLGYQRQCLQMLLAHAEQQPCSSTADSSQHSPVRYHMPQGLDLASYHSRQAATQAVATGLDALPHMAEIYPLGGKPPQLPSKISCIRFRSVKRAGMLPVLCRQAQA